MFILCYCAGSIDLLSLILLTMQGRHSAMGKGCKVVVCGLASVGKTAILEQLLYGNHAVGEFVMVSLFDDGQLWLLSGILLSHL